MRKHPMLWTGITIIDPRPVWAGRLASALRAEGFTGDVNVAVSKRQLLSVCQVPGPHLYFAGDVPFEKTGIPLDVLEFWKSKPCKLVFLRSDVAAFSAQLERENIDFAMRALDAHNSGMSVQALARQLIQFEPNAHSMNAIISPNRPQFDPVTPAYAATAPQTTTPQKNTRRISVIGLGASTGGVEALQVVLRDLPPSLPPILIVQHSRSTGGNGLVNVLGRASDVKVVPAENNMPLLPGHAYVATGCEHHLRLGRGSGLTLQLISGPSVSGHLPSVDVLFESLSELGSQAAAVLLTGMGQDGAAGLKRIRDRGGWTAAQDKASSVVYGMPRAAAECGAVEEQLSLKDVAPRLAKICQR